jgi:uncharacterized protein YdaU (DUF1376 family)
VKYPFMPLFLGDLLADTLHFSTQEFGAYMLLIVHAWKHNAKIATKDLRQVTRTSRHCWCKISQKISQKFDTTSDTNFWIQPRVKIELEKVEDISEKRRDAAQQMLSRRAANAAHPHLQPLKESSLELAKEAAKPVQTPGWRPRVDDDDVRIPPRTKSDNVLTPLPDKPLVAAKRAASEE